MNRYDLPLGHIRLAVIAIILVLGGLYAVIAMLLVLGGLYWIAGEVGLQIASIAIPGFLQVASVAISGLLTLALVVLYYQQYSVQSKQTDIMKKQQAVQKRQTRIMEQQQTIDEKQTELMERDYESSVFSIGQITAKEDYIYLSLNNAGRGTAQQIHLRSEIVSDTGSLDIEPGWSQVITVEGRDSTLPGVSPPKDFKAEVRFIQRRKSGEEKTLPFQFIADKLAREGIDECTIHLTLKIDDESTHPEDDVIEREIADQEVMIPELVEEDISEEEGEADTLETIQSTQLEDAIKPKFPQDILPHDFEERFFP